MKRYILGAIIGVGLVGAGYVTAKTVTVSDMEVVDQLGSVTKLYDNAAGIVCYIAKNERWNNVANGISCVKI